MTTVLTAACVGGGCSNEFGEFVSVSQGKRHRIDSPLSATRGLTLPQDQKFLVADAQRYSRGSGQADSVAADTGTARCSAAVASAGEAWAEFQLGHVLHNDTEATIQVNVTFDVDYEYLTSGGDSSEPDSPAAALKLYISDSNKTTLHRTMLFDVNGQDGPDQLAGNQSPTFALTMQPHLGYHLILAGRVEVSAESAGDPQSAQIKVKRLQIKVQAP